MNERHSEADLILNIKALDSSNIELTERVTALQEQNERFRAENDKVKQHYKELYDSIKITRAKTIEKTTYLLTKNEKLKVQLKEKIQSVTMPTVKIKVLALGMNAIDVKPIPPRNKNNMEVHLDYLKHLKESVETLCEIVEEARIEKPLDNALENACFYTKRSQELLEYVIRTCPKEFNKRDKQVANTPLNRKKQVTFKEPCDTSNNNTQTHVEQQKVQKTNVHVIPSIGINSSTEASGSKPRSNTKNNRILPAKSDNKKKVKAHPRNNKSKLKQESLFYSSISSKRTPDPPSPPLLPHQPMAATPSPSPPQQPRHHTKRVRLVLYQLRCVLVLIKIHQGCVDVYKEQPGCFLVVTSPQMVRLVLGLAPGVRLFGCQSPAGIRGLVWVSSNKVIHSLGVCLKLAVASIRAAFGLGYHKGVFGDRFNSY
uniref:Integrase, catalytic region, zinc finger, CCHC-type, peptidase aspartic, catalytic n=1 Tax=Tanacetum cinerariifolium TaxID=118510 RepID=A0A699GRI1_TANCI|nr:hypothetical protein [Tanacetum cinerariifolium]